MRTSRYTLIPLAVLCACACGGLPPSPAALEHNQHGAALLARRDLDGAEARFRLALELRPGFAEARANLGLVAAERGQLISATEHLEGAIELDRDFALGWAGLGLVLERRGELDEAENAYHSALALDPRLPTPRRNLGLLLARRGHLREARAQLLRLAAVDPGDVDALAHLAWCELRLGRPEAAFDRADRILRRIPGHGGHPRALLVRGAARARLGELDLAAADLTRAARARDLRVEALCRLALVLHLRGEVAAAREIVLRLRGSQRAHSVAAYVIARIAPEND